jgi:acetyl esterase/lipase
MSTDTSFIQEAGLPVESLRCTVSLDTEYDIANQVAQGGSQEALYRNAFGNDPAVWAEGSPIDHTDAGQVRPEFLIIAQGPPRRIDQAQAFADALERGGTPASVIDVNPLDHEGINVAVGAADDTVVTPPLMDFFRSCLVPST